MQLSDLDRHPNSGQPQASADSRSLRASVSDPSNPLTRIELSTLLFYYVEFLFMTLLYVTFGLRFAFALLLFVLAYVAFA